MAPPDTQKGLFTESPTKDRGDDFSDYRQLIGQLSEYLEDTKVSNIPDLYILEIEDFIFFVRKKANDKRWKLISKKVINSTYAIVSSLSYIIKNDPGKRSSTKFMNTAVKLNEIMKILEMVDDLNDDYKLPTHLDAPD